LDDPYTSLDVVRCPRGAKARAVRDLISEHFRAEDGTAITAASVVGSFTSYDLDTDAAEKLFENLIGLGGDLTLQLRTEHEMGEPGLVLAYAAGPGVFRGVCDRGGSVLVPAERVAELAACRTPARRAALAEELTGRLVLDALAN
jgi:hypothetical protein